MAKEKLSYITSDHDILDLAAYQLYNYEQYAFDLYEHPDNYGLALLDPVLPSGLVVAMPDFPKPSIYEDVIELW